jgi:hypothetical protein
LKPKKAVAKYFKRNLMNVVGYKVKDDYICPILRHPSLLSIFRIPSHPSPIFCPLLFPFALSIYLPQFQKSLTALQAPCAQADIIYS